MARKIRRTQAEEVIRMLKREGFKEVSKKEIAEEPYKTIHSLPDCFNASKNKQKTKTEK